MASDNRDRAVRKIFAQRGLQMKVAKACDVSRQAVGIWTRVPPQHVLVVSKLIGLTPQQIRPDIFGRR